MNSNKYKSIVFQKNVFKVKVLNGPQQRNTGLNILIIKNSFEKLTKKLTAAALSRKQTRKTMSSILQAILL